ncbi:hypothetical protein Aph01nite_43120 [Acrocarpospora phusangensis]|uniref:Uncharacterized protein n=1 Tax=Acrocarpospora phusangensis TaxID=1070424 RepID=A0A919QBR9_9ACTN|nr:hypothetical protein [Acrocarpospora phusangensis]GIH26002.1 hypothetical protein Aph01nite_43120 [Acrocarpospora phusangensis]
MTSSHTPAPTPGITFAVRIKDGATIVADHTEPTADLAVARTRLSALRRAYPESLLLVRPHDGSDADWRVADDDELKRISYGRAASVIGHLVANRDLPLLDWAISDLIGDDQVGVSVHVVRTEMVEAVAGVLGCETVTESRLMTATATYRGVQVSIRCYLPAESKAAA